MSVARDVLVIDDSPTILKVVQMVLSKAGYAVRTASDGQAGIDAARERRPDVILLDFVMPQMNGYQVCRALAEIDGLREVPVVLMSAKGDQVGERFVRVMGIVDYITKPFSPEAITAVVGHTLSKYAPEAPKPRPAFELDPSVETVPFDVTEEESTGRKSVRDATARVLSESLLRRQRVEQLRALVIEALGGDLVPELRDEVERRLSDDLLGRFVDGLELPPSAEVGREVVLEGDLASVPIAEVLSLLGEQRQTGILAVMGADARIAVHYRGGKVDFASAEGLGEEMLLGRFLLELELIQVGALQAFLDGRNTRPPGRARWIGEELVQDNLVDQAGLREALRRQSCERIYEMLRWRGGRFAFRATKDLGPLAEDAQLGMTIDAILLEGVRRVDEWHMIERAIDDFDAVFVRNEVAPVEIERARLGRDELAVLDLVNGKNTVKEITRQSRMSSFDVTKMLYRLLAIKLIRRRVPPVAM